LNLLTFKLNMSCLADWQVIQLIYWFVVAKSGRFVTWVRIILRNRLRTNKCWRCSWQRHR